MIEYMNMKTASCYQGVSLNTYSSSLGSVQAISTGVSLQGERKKLGNPKHNNIQTVTNQTLTLNDTITALFRVIHRTSISEKTNPWIA